MYRKDKLVKEGEEHLMTTSPKGVDKVRRKKENDETRIP